MLSNAGWYLAVGLAVAAAVIVGRWTELPRGGAGRTKSISIITGVSALAWPIVVPLLTYWLLKSRFSAAGSAAEEKPFEPTPAHLCDHLSLAEIECAETVVDPLEAAPRLPFGHLNSVWQRFVAEMEPGSDVWSFRTNWKTSWRSQEVRAGYAAVTNGRVTSFVETI